MSRKFGYWVACRFWVIIIVQVERFSIRSWILCSRCLVWQHRKIIQRRQQFSLSSHLIRLLHKMGCFSQKPGKEDDEDRSRREANKRIEKQLQKDKQAYRATHRLLLLGNGSYSDWLWYKRLALFVLMMSEYHPLSFGKIWAFRDVGIHTHRSV